MVTNNFHVANDKAPHALMGDFFSMFWIMGEGEGIFFLFPMCSH
jgi:hypothetical protein